MQMRFIFFNKPNNVPKVTGIQQYLCERLGLGRLETCFLNVSVSWHRRLGLVVQRLVYYILATYIEINRPSCILNAACWILNKRVNGTLKRVVNNKLRMVYYLIVYTVLLVQFPKKKICWPPPINKTWIHH